MAKTSVKITGVKEIGLAVKKSINLIANESALFKEMGDDIIKGISGNARAGKDQNNAPLKPVSDGWKKRRDRLATVNSTHPTFPSRGKQSRLTFTGQLLDSMRSRFTKATLTIGIFFYGNRKPYKGIRKPQLDGIDNNAELAEKIEETRPFLFIGEKLNKRLVLKVVKKLRQNLKNYKRLSRVLGR